MYNRHHILVVENDQDMLQTIEFILESADYRVTTVANGQEALEKILPSRHNNLPIDLLVTDILMPGLTCMELMDELNRLNYDIPVFVIAGYRDKRLKIEMLCKGCREYLERPFDDEELIMRLAMLFDEEGKRG